VRQQQSHRHDRRGRIGDALTGNVGCAAVDRLEHRWIGPGGIDISAGGQANSAAHRRGQVGDDVAEQIVGDDHVKATGVGDKEDRGRVDVLISDLDVWIFRADLRDDPRPQRPGEHQNIVLVHKRQVLTTLPGPLERVFHYSAHTERGIDADLGGDLVGRSDADRATVTGVRALGPLAHHHEVDVGVSRERTVHPGV